MLVTEGLHYDLGGYQRAFRINVADFGYSEGDKIAFINDLLLGRIKREELINKVAVQQQVPEEAWTGLQRHISQDRILSIAECTLQGVFVGTVSSGNDSYRTNEGVYMIPISARKAVESIPAAQPQQTSDHIVDSLYAQLRKQETSVVKGELHCSKSGSRLLLPQSSDVEESHCTGTATKKHLVKLSDKQTQVNLVDATSVGSKQKHFKTVLTRQKDTAVEHENVKPRRPEKHHQERRKTKSIEPGIVRRLCEMFSSEENPSSVKTKRSVQKTETTKVSRKPPLGGKSSQMLSRKKSKPSKVDTAINTNISHITLKKKVKSSHKCQPINQRVYFSKVKINNNEKESKIVQPNRTRQGDNHFKKIEKYRKLDATPAPSTGNSHAYKLAESESDYDDDLYSEICCSMAGCSSVCTRETATNISDSQTMNSYTESSLGSSFEQEKRFRCCSATYARTILHTSDTSSCSSSSSSVPNCFLGRHIHHQSGKCSTSKTTRKHREESCNCCVRIGRQHRGKRQTYPDRSCYKKQTEDTIQAHDRRPAESPGPRSVDQIEYPFSYTSASENYGQVNEVMVESSVAKNQLQSAKPDGRLKFQELKKELEHFRALKKECIRRNRAKKAERKKHQSAEYHKRNRHSPEVQVPVKPQNKFLVNQEMHSRYIDNKRSPSEANYNKKTTNLNPDDKPNYRPRGKPTVKKVDSVSSSSFHQIRSDSGSTDEYYQAPMPRAKSLRSTVFQNADTVYHQHRTRSNVPITRKTLVNLSNFKNLPVGSDIKEGNSKTSVSTSQSKLSSDTLSLHGKGKIHTRQLDLGQRNRKVAESRTCRNNFLAERELSPKCVDRRLQNEISEPDSRVPTPVQRGLVCLRPSSINGHEIKVAPVIPSREVVSVGDECPGSLRRKTWDVVEFFKPMELS